MCEGGSEYVPCHNLCEETCENIGDEPEGLCSDSNCMEGCFCPGGTYRFVDLILLASLCN